MVSTNGMEMGLMAAERDKITNRLLRALSADAFEFLSAHLMPVDLPLRHVLVEANVPSTHVCFVESGLASMVATSSDSENVEIGHIGFEGVAAAHVLLSVGATPNRTFMQVEGQGFLLGVAELRELTNTDPFSRDLLLRYVHCSNLQLAYSALANARYSIHERLARWLLMCHDRLGSNDLSLTHEFLALMLGVRRSGVTNELHVLEGVRAIKATRGNVRVLDRPRLEEIAGGSYGAPERAYVELIEAVSTRFTQSR
jgi:CRP-like cAMP-binding protein